MAAASEQFAGWIDVDVGDNAARPTSRQPQRRGSGVVRPALAELPVDPRRDHSRCAAVLALTAARDGQLERATAAGQEALDLCAATRDAHAVADLGRTRTAMDSRALGGRVRRPPAPTDHRGPELTNLATRPATSIMGNGPRRVIDRRPSAHDHGGLYSR